MSSSSSQQQMQIKQPWGPADSHLQNIMQEAGTLYAQGAGSGQWGGTALAPTSAQTQQGFGRLVNTAMASDTSAPYNAAVAGSSNGGITPQMQPSLGVLGNISNGTSAINTGGQYGNLYNQSLTQNQQPNSIMGGIANNGALAGDNPHLQAYLEANAARIANRVNSSMSGAGRYGSGSHTDLMARSIAEANNPVLFQAYENDQGRRLQDAGLRLNAANTLAGSQRADVAGASSALAGQTGVQQQNISNQMNASGGLLDNYARGQQQAQAWAALAPQLNDLKYDPAMRLLGAGSFLDSRAQAEQDFQRQQFDAANNMPWTQLAKYQGSVSGLSPLIAGLGATFGNSNATQTPNPMSYFAGGDNSVAAGLSGLGSSGLGLLSKLFGKAA